MEEKNILFMDGEFAKLKPDGIDLLSIALIKPTGEELYLELEFYGEIDEWVKENVIPNMKGKKVSKEEAVKQIKKFVGSSKPYLIAHVNQFDWMGICRLFDANEPKKILEKVPFHWVPIDFSTMLFERGIKPGTPNIKTASKHGIDVSGIKEHNALDDARLLKSLYEKIILKK